MRRAHHNSYRRKTASHSFDGAPQQRWAPIRERAVQPTLGAEHKVVDVGPARQARHLAAALQHPAGRDQAHVHDQVLDVAVHALLHARGSGGHPAPQRAELVRVRLVPRAQTMLCQLQDIRLFVIPYSQLRAFVKIGAAKKIKIQDIDKTQRETSTLFLDQHHVCLLLTHICL